MIEDLSYSVLYTIGSFIVMNLVDNVNQHQPSSALPLTQHHSFFRNLPHLCTQQALLTLTILTLAVCQIDVISEPRNCLSHQRERVCGSVEENWRIWLITMTNQPNLHSERLLQYYFCGVPHLTDIICFCFSDGSCDLLWLRPDLIR